MAWGLDRQDYRISKGRSAAKGGALFSLLGAARGESEGVEGALSFDRTGGRVVLSPLSVVLWTGLLKGFPAVCNV